MQRQQFMTLIVGNSPSASGQQYKTASLLASTIKSPHTHISIPRHLALNTVKAG